MAKIDLTKQARAPQQRGQFLRTTYVTSSVTSEYEWETADFNFTGSFTGSFSGSFAPTRIFGLGIVSSSAQTKTLLPAGSVSSSTQVKSNLPAGSVSSSAQIKANLPAGTVSHSIQLNSAISGSLSKAHLATKVPNIVSGSAQLASAISGSLSATHLATKIPALVSGSQQILDLLPRGIRSGSEASDDDDKQTLGWNPSTYGLSISNGNSVDLSSLAGGGGGGGSGDGLAITASNDGSLLSQNIRSFNFTGPALTATSNGNAITVTATTGSRVTTANVTASMFLLREIQGATPNATEGSIMYSGSAFYVGL